ncbi:hypothetical protein [Chlorobium sp. N1]|uniref:hypothetical protein n=1 Tax=Chlorobium sp. N1 TaxID=2491138 RepID=UPI0013F15512|nr:hypothetical protein [Chlorobium sp. N1]
MPGCRRPPSGATPGGMLHPVEHLQLVAGGLDAGLRLHLADEILDPLPPCAGE